VKLKRIKKFIIFLIIIVMAFVSFDLIYPEYEYIQDDENTHIVINDKNYYFYYDSWSYNNLDKKIGFIKDDPKYFKLFYYVLPHGIYSIKDDKEQKYYQIIGFMFSDYPLMVREDIDLPDPDADNIDYMIYDDNNIKIDDKGVISKVLDLYYSDEYDLLNYYEAESSMIKLYLGNYPELHYNLHISYDINEEIYLLYMKNNFGYKIIPNDIMNVLLESNID